MEIQKDRPQIHAVPMRLRNVFATNKYQESVKLKKTRHIYAVISAVIHKVVVKNALCFTSTHGGVVCMHVSSKAPACLPAGQWRQTVPRARVKCQFGITKLPRHVEPFQ
jgi:hypothetical protein